jgi:acyl-CoA synthetase (AMP-forming)/AMP-acid ligase II
MTGVSRGCISQAFTSGELTEKMNTNINIGQLISKRAYLHPDKLALNDALADRRHSYAEFNARLNRVCGVLSSHGLAKGDRVALLTYNGHEFLEAFFAIAKTGLVAVPINCRLTTVEISYILNDCAVRSIIFDSEFASTIEELQEMGRQGSVIESWFEIRGSKVDFAFDYEQLLLSQSAGEPPVAAGGDDNLFIMYTSGTTGYPKGAVLTHNTVFWSVINYSVTAPMHFDDIHLVFLPLFHVAALMSATAALYNGNSLVVLRSFDPKTSWSLIVDEKISTSCAVPAMLNFMLQVPDFETYDWSSLRWFLCGGAPLSVETIKAYKKVGIDVNQAFGMTEACGAVSMVGSEDGMRKAGSVGKAYFHTELRIVDSNGVDLPAGQEGEIFVRSPTVMKEYWNLPEATAEAIRDGWYHTGDIAVADEEGFITIKDRITDMIISGGENVYPAEVEFLLLQHPGILDAAVIGRDSKKWGESPFAVVVPKSAGLTELDVTSHCDGKLARFKIPKGVAFVDELPRNSIGKVLKRVLREQFPGVKSE